MNKQQDFDLLAREFNLKDADFYFLELIPLIEMIWADDHNQASELSLLYKFTIEHIAALDRSSGLPFVSVEEANDFLDRFARQRPPRQLLARLSELVASSAVTDDSNRQETVLNYCMDIAAACTVRYPFGPQERIIESEKALLNKLFSAYTPSRAT